MTTDDFHFRSKSRMLEKNKDAPSLQEALSVAIFAMESVRNLQGIDALTPYINRCKAALDAALKEGSGQ